MRAWFAAVHESAYVPKRTLARFRTIQVQPKDRPLVS
jgi:hypothetical protein